LRLRRWLGLGRRLLAGGGSRGRRLGCRRGRGLLDRVAAGGAEARPGSHLDTAVGAVPRRRCQGGAARRAEARRCHVLGVAVGTLDGGRSARRRAEPRSTAAEAGRGRGRWLGRLLLQRAGAHTDAGGQEGSAGGAAALGHPLTGAQLELAGGVLLERPRQARIGGVLGQPLERLLVLI